MNTKTLIIMTLIFSTVCCHDNNDEEYFKGEIRYFDERDKIVKNVTSTVIHDDNTYSGSIAVYDSLVICWNPRLPNCFFNVFNLETGKEIGLFCNRGQGPEESSTVNPIVQYFKKGTDLITILNANNENRLLFWNISKSVEQRKTVFESIISYENRNEDKSPHHDLIYFQSDDILLARVAAWMINLEESTTLYYEKRTIHNNQLLREYPIYKKTMRKGNAKILPSSFFHSNDVIKPDGSKMAQAMLLLPQINILDIHTGNLVGYRIKRGPGFSIFESRTFMYDDFNSYYSSIQADDNYIYATYWGKTYWSIMKNQIPFLNTIHVFDWNGKQLYELITDRTFFHISLDPVRNRLYTIDLETDELSFIDLNKLKMISLNIMQSAYLDFNE